MVSQTLNNCAPSFARNRPSLIPDASGQRIYTRNDSSGRKRGHPNLCLRAYSLAPLGVLSKQAGIYQRGEFGIGASIVMLREQDLALWYLKHA